ncbi:TPA: TIGR04197 family type VII secretion effector [Staphylococcus aureus]|nr:TIGR04197 family type VII secretion effector [Staphylococcus aureus]HDF4509730.1 TIGR04197 family type VII secretion effector [Staphylococcus aureus]
MMSTVQSDIFKTNSASSSIKSAVETCNNVSKPDKDESTTVSGNNNNAHSVIDDLISKNQSVAEAIRNASDSIQKVGEEFNQTDVMIGNEIGKN